MLSVLSQIVAILAVLATAVVYGTDMCAVLILSCGRARLLPTWMSAGVAAPVVSRIARRVRSATSGKLLEHFS